MKLFRSLAAALLLLFAAGPAFAQDQEVGDWGIYTNETNCSAIAPFGDSTMVWVGYSVKDDRATMMIMDSKVFADVSDGVPIDAKLAFVRGEQLVDEWMNLSVTGAVLDNGAKGVLIRAPGDAFLKTMATSQFLGLLRGSEAVISVKTGEVGNVVSALRACAAKIK